MGVITEDEVIERVAVAIHSQGAELTHWAMERLGLQERYRQMARAAIKAHKAAYQTPYADDEHQGGNLLEWFILVAGRASRAEEELRAIRAYAVKHSGEPVEDDDTTLRAVELLHSALGGWKGLADTYADEREEALKGQVAAEAALKDARQGEMDFDLYGRLVRFAKDLQSKERTGRERGTPNEIARDDGYSYAQVDIGNELEEMLTPRPDTFSVQLERAREELGRRQRQGQVAMNVLGIVRSDLYSAVSGTLHDPFHNDGRLPAFFTWLADVISAEKAQTRVDNRHELVDVEEEFNTHG